MSIPLKHHYLPEFYLKRWAGRDRRLVEYRRVRPEKPINVRRVFPSETGFMPELYSIKSRSNSQARQQVEREFMAPLDSDAAIALDRLEREGTVRDPATNRNWARFVVSLLNRHPQRIEWFDFKLAQQNQVTLARIENSYAVLRRPDDPTTFQEYKDQAEQTYLQENRAVLVRDMINSSLLGGHIAGMRWKILELGRIKYGFLTGDDPVMTSNGIAGRDSFIVLPVAPSKVFVAVNDTKVLEAFASQPTRLERAFNDAITHQASSLVLGHDASQREFVERRLRKTFVNSRFGPEDRATWASPLVRR